MKLGEHLYLPSGGVYGKLGDVYASQYGNDYILIDCGRYDTLDIVRQNMAYWDISEHKITYVLLTHGHDDHVGSSSWFRSIGAQVYVGTGDEMNMVTGDFGPENSFANHVVSPCHPGVCIHEDMDISIGDLCIYALYMLGHISGSMLYCAMLDEKAMLFSGDMFFADGETGEAVYIEWKGDMAYDGLRLLESFQELWRLQLHPDMVADGHGIPVVGGHADQITMLTYKYAILNSR